MSVQIALLYIDYITKVVFLNQIVSLSNDDTKGKLVLDFEAMKGSRVVKSGVNCNSTALKPKLDVQLGVA